jgi:hypothetical protein
MTPVYIYRHRQKRDVHCCCLHDAKHFEKSDQWELVESVDPLAWIAKHYPADRETVDMAKLGIPNGFKLVRVPFGYQVVSIKEEKNE